MNIQYIKEQYEQQGRSPGDIANELHTYPNAIRRALEKNGVRLRDRSQAQSKAISTGRHPHPTIGKTHSPATRRLIGERVAEAYEAVGAEEKELRRKNARKRWKSMKKSQKQKLMSAAWKAVRKAVDEGSKLERFLLTGLSEARMSPVFHGGQADIELPGKILIFVNGPSHYRPVWGDEALARTKSNDERKQADLIATGHSLIVVKNLVEHASEIKYRTCLTQLLDVLESSLTEPRIYELEIK